MPDRHKTDCPYATGDARRFFHDEDKIRKRLFFQKARDVAIWLTLIVASCVAIHFGR